MFAVRLLVAAAPVIALLGGILWLRWRAYRAAALAWLVALGGALLFFGAGPVLLAVASAKGLSLALLVMLIVWAAVFLYNLVNDLGAVKVIATKLMSSTSDPLLLGLLLAWTFSGFMQGIAGFGVPVAVIAPLMVLAGFSSVQAIAAVMIGHSWAITFGSMGSSFYAIGFVMQLDVAVLGPLLALMFFLPIVLTGLSVAHITTGWAGVWRAIPLVFVTALLMNGLMWATNALGAAPVSSMLPGLLGSLILWSAGRTIWYRTPAVSPDAAEANGLSFRWAFLPYALLTLFSIVAQVPIIKQSAAPLRFALDYPAQSTALGFEVAPAASYAPIQLVGHPAPLLLLSALLTFVVYHARGMWETGAANRAWQITVRQTTSTTVGVSLMVMTALVLADSGMAATLAQGAETLGGQLYLLAAPFIGLLGAFVTGSNTNSNVMFGPLQLYAAQVLALNVLLVAAAQTLGGSIGSGVAPDKALIGVSVVDTDATEEEVMRRTLPYGLLTVLAIGLQVLLVWLVGNA